MSISPPLDWPLAPGLWLIRAVVLAAGVELVVLRLVTRTAIHIPGISKVESPYRLAAETGRYAYYVALVLVVIALGSVVRRELQAGRIGWNLVAVGWFIAAAGATRLGLMSDSALSWSVVGSAVLLVPATMRRYQTRMAPILLFGTSFVVAGLHNATQSQGIGSFIGQAPNGLLVLAEALAVLACLTSPMLVETKRRTTPLVGGVGMAIATFMALVANQATVKILLLWNFGLAGYFPAIVYSIAFGALTFTVLQSRPTDARLALGLGLLVIGGLGLHSSYQSGLVLLGLVVLGAPDLEEETAVWKPEPFRPRLRFPLTTASTN